MQVAPDIHLIKCPYLNSFTTVCAILGAREIVLIDSGATASPDEAILPYLRNIGRKPEEITHLILTHGHLDHVGGAALLKKRYSAKIVIHELERPFVEDALLNRRQLFSRFGIPIPKEAPFSSVQADITINGDNALLVAGHHFSFLHLPGHSAGSMAVIDREQGLYVTGDTPQGSESNGLYLFYDFDQYEASAWELHSEPIERLVLGHPFPPLQKEVLDADEAKVFVMESIAAAREFKAKVYRKLEEAKKPSTLEEIHSRLPGSQIASVGCILESLVREGKARVLRTDAYPRWTTP